MQMTLTITAESPSEMVTVLTALQGAGVGTDVRLAAKTLGPPVDPELAAGAAVTPVVEPTTEPSVKPTTATALGQAPVRRGRPPKPGGATGGVVVTAEPAVKEPAKLKVVPKEEAKVEVEKKDVTILDVRKALTEYLAANDETKAAALLAKHGKTDRLSKLEEQYFEAVYYAAVTPAVKDEFSDDIPDLGAAQ